MKILIITHYYKHKNAMASVRPIKLAKFFSRMGHSVTVLTSLQKDNWCKRELTPSPSTTITEIYAPPHKGMKYLTKIYDRLRSRGEKKQRAAKCEAPDTNLKATNKKPNPLSRVKSQCMQKLSWLFYYTSDRLENYFLSQGLINKAKSEDLAGFDVVIATYPGAGVHTAGEWFKKKKRTKYFIADYRDPAYNPGARNNKIEAKHDKHVQDLAIRYADAVVCVSQGMADSLRSQYPKEVLPEINVVRNGFDPEDNNDAVSADFDQSKFNFVYTGALYQGRRTVDMLARVLDELIKEDFVSSEDIAINYAGPDFAELIDQLKPYHLEGIAVDCGYVSREQSLGMQEGADIVLLLNWNDDNYTGVIPGKLYEYMSSKRPICALIMGNQSGSESAKMIEEYELGCACEQASPQDLIKLQGFIKKQLAAFKEGERQAVSSDKTRQFEYQNIAKEYLNIISRMI